MPTETEKITVLDIDDVEQVYVTVAAAARYLGISQSYLYHKLGGREIPFYKIGRNVRFKLEELDAYVKRVAPIEKM